MEGWKEWRVADTAAELPNQLRHLPPSSYLLYLKSKSFVSEVIANWISLLITAENIPTEPSAFTDISGTMKLSTQIFLGGRAMPLSSLPKQQLLLALQILAQASHF